MHAVRRSLVAIAVAGLGLTTIPVTSLAQAHHLPAPRNATVRLSGTGVHAPDVLPAGRYRLAVRAPRHRQGFLQLVKPDRGYTQADLRADSRRPGRAATRRILSSIRFFGGTQVRPGGSGALWETLYAGRYWLVGGAARPGGISVETIRVHGTPAPSSFPRVSAHATGTDKGLRLTRTVPQFGRMLVRNSSRGPDLMILLPLKDGATYADFLRWVRRQKGQPPLRFRGIRSTGVLSPRAGYVLRYQLHPGDYVVLSLSSLSQRTVRGIFRPLTVVRAGAGSAKASTARGGQGFARAPGAARRIEGWLGSADGDRTAPTRRVDRALVRRSLTHWAAPTVPR